MGIRILAVLALILAAAAVAVWLLVPPEGASPSVRPRLPNAAPQIPGPPRRAPRPASRPAPTAPVVTAIPFDDSLDQLTADGGEAETEGKVRIEAVFADGKPVANMLVRLVPEVPADVGLPDQEWTDDHGVAWVEPGAGPNTIEIALNAAHGMRVFREPLAEGATRRRVVVPIGHAFTAAFTVEGKPPDQPVSWHATVHRGPDGDPRRPPVSSSGWTENDGTFSIEEVDPTDELDVYVDPPHILATGTDGLTLHGRCLKLSAAAAAATIPVQPEPVLHGRLVDASTGSPVAGKVTVELAIECADETRKRYTTEPPSDGTFRFPLGDVPMGLGTLRFEYRCTREPLSLNTVPIGLVDMRARDLADIVVTMPSRVPIVVVDDRGEPVEGAEVYEIKSEAPPGETTHRVCARPTDPDGRTDAMVLAPCRVWVDERMAAREMVELTPADVSEHVVVVQRYARLNIPLPESTLGPTPCVVRVTGTDPSVAADMQFGDGWGGVFVRPKTEWIVEVYDSLLGEALWSQRVTLPPGAARTLIPTLPPSHGFTLAVIDEHGEPVKSGSCYLECARGESPSSFFQRVIDGRAVVTGLYATVVRLTVVDGNGRRFDSPDFKIPENGATVTIRLDPPRKVDSRPGDDPDDSGK